MHDAYFNPEHVEFAPRSKWSLNSAFRSAFKLLDPVPLFKSTASLGEFFNTLN
jgi:hypothetical protein